MAKEYWDRLHGLYHEVQNGTNQMPVEGGASPAPQGFSQGGLAEAGPVAGFADGGLVDNAEQREAPGSMGRTNPTYNSGGWGDVASNFGKGFIGNLVPAAGAAATGMMIDRMFPGTKGQVRAQDMRQPEMQQGSTMALSNLQNLQQNPNSFGLPGDPNDVNTPAGQRMYQLKRNVRSADAARGMLETGGSGQRETDAVNNAIASDYRSALNSGFSNLTSQTPQLQRMDRPAVANPFAKILTEALAPGVSKGLKAATDKWFV